MIKAALFSVMAISGVCVVGSAVAQVAGSDGVANASPTTVSSAPVGLSNPAGVGQVYSVATPALSAVVVTGTRLETGVASPTPLTMESIQQLQTLAPNSVGEALAQLPAFVGSQVTSSLGTASSAVGASQSLLNLRNLGANRTLILLDGERLPATNVNGSVDINVIPQALLSRVEVVTGGASASYGSDAVAGVVNFILNKHFTGMKVDINGGETTYGDARNFHGVWAGGLDLFGGRGHVEGSVEYFQQSGIGLPGNTGRSWLDDDVGLVRLPAGSPTIFGLISDTRLANVAYGGLVVSATSTAGKPITVPGLSGMQFGPGGILEPFSLGALHTPDGKSSGGSGPLADFGLSPAQKRGGAFIHAEYDLTPDFTAFVEAMYNRSWSDEPSYDLLDIAPRGFTIYADNAFLSPAVQKLMSANDVASFEIGRFDGDVPPWLNLNISTLSRFNTGFRARLSDHWSLDGSIAAAKSQQEFDEHLTINRNLYAAADAVVNPATGQIACYSTLEGLDPGCVPIDVLGPSSISAAGAAYVSGWDVGDTVDNQLAAEINIRGNLGQRIALGAGPIDVAVGGAWRRDNARRTVSPLSDIHTSCAGLRPGGCTLYNGIYGGYMSYNPGPLSGRIGVGEAYTELGIPVLRNLPLIHLLNVDLAGRVTDYSTSGLTYTWKLGSVWEVSRELKLRATRSQDIRAPDLNELFSTVSGTGQVTSILYPNSAAPGPLPTSTVTVERGNPNLVPEVAQTSTFGAVYHPRWLSGFEGSLDYYDIKISNAITTIPTQAIVDGCSAGDQALCQLITLAGKPVASTTGLNGATGISINSAPVNVAQIATSGLDLELAYHIRALDGNFNLRALGNYALTFRNSSSRPPRGPIYIDSYGLGAAAVPQWTLDLTEAYERDLNATRSISVGLVQRMISAGAFNLNYTAAQFPASENHVPQITYLDLNAGYRFEAFGSDEIYFSVINLFNTPPPAVPTESTGETPTDFSLYDVLGRRFTLGFKMQW